PIVGTGQKAETFCERMFDKFVMLCNREIPTLCAIERGREADSVRQRWSKIQSQCQLFSAAYGVATSQVKSGWVEADYIVESKRQYRESNNNKDFLLVEAWEVVRDSLKFAPVAIGDDSENSGYSGIATLGDGQKKKAVNQTGQVIGSLVRPIGVKKAKVLEKIKKREGGLVTAAVNDNKDSSFVAELEDFSIRRDERRDEKRDQRKLEAEQAKKKRLRQRRRKTDEALTFERKMAIFNQERVKNADDAQRFERHMAILNNDDRLKAVKDQYVDMEVKSIMAEKARETELRCANAMTDSRNHLLTDYQLDNKHDDDDVDPPNDDEFANEYDDDDVDEDISHADEMPQIVRRSMPSSSVQETQLELVVPETDVPSQYLDIHPV
ncbi:MAG: hypothetical protein ACREOZ_05350, partial [Gloeomargaritales cyanobacterium]